MKEHRAPLSTEALSSGVRSFSQDKISTAQTNEITLRGLHVSDSGFRPNASQSSNIKMALEGHSSTVS